jgi:hypothetical protein
MIVGEPIHVDFGHFVQDWKDPLHKDILIPDFVASSEERLHVLSSSEQIHLDWS